MRLLHIIATPRVEDSHTLAVSSVFLDELGAHVQELSVTTVDLFHADLPAAAGTNIDVKYSLLAGGPIDKKHAESWQRIEHLIEDFVSADMYLVTCPMWNFSIPYALKYYIDCLVQPGYVYRYDEQGRAVPLVLGKKMVCVTSRGGAYGPASPLREYDFQEPYLRTIFGFIGVTDVTFVNAEPMDVSPALRQSALASAVAQAREVASAGSWHPSRTDGAEEHPPFLKPQPLHAGTRG